jgi:hypothetical protein
MLPHHSFYLQRMLGFAELAHLPNCCLARFDSPREAGGSWQIKLV